VHFKSQNPPRATPTLRGSEGGRPDAISRWLAPHPRSQGSHKTRRWRRQSRANSSLNWGSWRLELRRIPKRFWMMIEAKKGYFGLEYAGILVFAPRQPLLLCR
jgi:hypothetical protein